MVTECVLTSKTLKGEMNLELLPRREDQGLFEDVEACSFGNLIALLSAVGTGHFGRRGVEKILQATKNSPVGNLMALLSIVEQTITKNVTLLIKTK